MNVATRVTAILGFLALAPAVACKKEPQAPAVGWNLDVDGEALKEGRVRSIPPGGEEALVPGLAQASRGWAQSCASAVPAAATTVAAVLILTPDGAVSAFQGSKGDPLTRCLAGQAQGMPLPGAAGAGERRLELALRFEPPKR